MQCMHPEGTHVRERTWRRRGFPRRKGGRTANSISPQLRCAGSLQICILHGRAVRMPRLPVCPPAPCMLYASFPWALVR